MRVYIVNDQIAGIATPGLDIFPTLEAPDGYEVDDLYVSEGIVKVKPPKPDKNHIWSGDHWESLDPVSQPSPPSPSRVSDEETFKEALTLADADTAIQAKLITLMFAELTGNTELAKTASQQLDKLVKDKQKEKDNGSNTSGK